ncbi:MAG: DUF4190 domain-containing protein [Planctomycetaceae bacterium]
MSTQPPHNQPPPSPQPPYPYPPPNYQQGDATGGLIPYKNGAALAAYYLGIFSLIPVVGILLGIPAVILGIVGLKRARENPHVKGGVHAWVGIVMGSLMTLLWLAVAVVPITIALLSS